MKKLITFCGAAILASNAFAVDVEQTYQKTCAVCHVAGVAGAPKSGDAAAWAPRLEKGMDTLVASVTNGKGAMPPKGLCNECTADDYKALIGHMSK